MPYSIFFFFFSKEFICTFKNIIVLLSQLRIFLKRIINITLHEINIIFVSLIKMNV